ncbi:MAG: histidine kinase [Saprospiraceae bacterium]|nr:histidine kinase [Saprospiraceae bacterium]
MLYYILSMGREDLTIIIISFVGILLIMVSVIFVLFYFFNQKRIRYILEKQEAERSAERELEKARIENQEHLLQNLSWELHDNIGQLISVSKMQLSMMKEPPLPADRKILGDTIEILGKTLDDVRSLSRSLNTESIMSMGLLKATSFETDRLNRLKFVKAQLNIDGTPIRLPEDHEIILFRIIQELISNVIKHAKATDFVLTFRYDKDRLQITCVDNGIGMSSGTSGYGLGLKNIMSRSSMLHAVTTVENPEGGGLRTTISYPIVHPVNIAG